MKHLHVSYAAHLEYKQYRGPGVSSWSLEDVYMETSYVLSGLSRKAGLCLLSFPTQATSFETRMESGSDAREHRNNEAVSLCSKKDVTVEKETQDSGHSDDAMGRLLSDTRDYSEAVFASSNFSTTAETNACTFSCCEKSKSEGKDGGVNSAGERICVCTTTLQNDQSTLDSIGGLQVTGVDDTKCNSVSEVGTVEEIELSIRPSVEGNARSVFLTEPDEVSDEDEYVCVTDDETCPIQEVNCSDSKWDTSNDLPLMANVDEVLVFHYVLNLEVNFDEKVMNGDITLFLKPATEVVLQRQFQLCLDCSLVHIESVEEIGLRDDFSVKYYGTQEQNEGNNAKCSSYPSNVFQVDRLKPTPVALPYTMLPYAVHNWCMRVWKPKDLGRRWPRCVRIKYRTSPEGKSLTWANDQDRR